MKSEIIKRAAWSSFILCIGCCAALPVMALLGITLTLGITFYIEAVAGVLLVFSLLSLLYYQLSHKKSDKNCNDCCLPKEQH